MSEQNTFHIGMAVNLSRPQRGLKTFAEMTWDRDDDDDDDDSDDDVTLYLHIYENALSCALIWLIAGRNWGGCGGNGCYSINCKIKYARVVRTYLHLKPRLWHHKEIVNRFPCLFETRKTETTTCILIYSIIHFGGHTWSYKAIFFHLKKFLFFIHFF